MGLGGMVIGVRCGVERGGEWKGNGRLLKEAGYKSCRDEGLSDGDGEGKCEGSG